MLDLKTLEGQLTALEDELHRRIEDCLDAASGEFTSPGQMLRLKSAVDRVRPLLWIYLHRQGVSFSQEQENHSDPPNNVQRLMANAGLQAVKASGRVFTARPGEVSVKSQITATDGAKSNAAR